jgi:plasmid stability protein
MTVNLSIKQVPDELAARLRARAARNRRSLQRELLCILESVTGFGDALHVPAPTAPRPLTIEEVAARARALFPRGTESSTAYIRELRNRS